MPLGPFLTDGGRKKYLPKSRRNKSGLYSHLKIDSTATARQIKLAHEQEVKKIQAERKKAAKALTGRTLVSKKAALTVREEKVNEACRILLDKGARQQYDREYLDTIAASSTIRVQRHRANMSAAKKRSTYAKNNARRTFLKQTYKHEPDVEETVRPSYAAFRRNDGKVWKRGDMAQLLLPRFSGEWQTVKLVSEERINTANRITYDKWWIVQLPKTFQEDDGRVSKNRCVCVTVDWLRE